MTNVWIGITKNQRIATFGSGTDVTTNAEKYLEYQDGTSYKAIGGIIYEINDNYPCMRFTSAATRWSDGPCTQLFHVLCEFNCDNINDI